LNSYLSKTFRLFIVFSFTLCSFQFAQAAPGGVGGNLRIWLDADNGVTGTSAITQWEDQSGNGKHVTQGIFAYQPSLNTASNMMNFHQSIEMDGNLDHLETSGVMPNDTDDITFFIVTDTDQSSGDYNQFFGMGSFLAYPHVGFLSSAQVFYSSGVFLPDYRYFNTSEPMRHNEPLIYSGAIDFDSGSSPAYNYLNGYQNSDIPTVNGEDSHGGTGRFAVGGDDFNEDLDGRIAEFVLYNTLLTATQRHQVESYLAVKYGQSLTNNYLNSSATTTYTLDGTYNYGIFGLAKDLAGDLDQRISRSVNDTSGLVLSTDSDFSSANATHADTFSDGSYLLIGHDNGSAVSTQTSDLSTTFDKRTIREWKVENTSSVGAINMQFTTLPILVAGQSYALIGDSDGDFTSGSTVLKYSNNTTFSDITFPADTSYFTVAIITNKVEFTLASNSDNEEDGANLPAIAVFGYISTTSAITLNLTGTATSSSDYTVPTLSIPAGIYNGQPASNLSLTNFSILDDTTSENNETIITTLDLGAITDFVIGDANSDTTTQSTFTYTIIDEDISVTASGSLLTATDNNAIANGSDVASVALQLKETDGDNILLSGVDVTFSISSGTATFSNNLTSYTTVTNASGLASATVKSVFAGLVNITAILDQDEDGGASPQESVSNGSPTSVTFLPGLVSAANTTISLSTNAVTADGSSSSIITVQAKDAQGNNLISSGGAVILAENSATAVLSPVTNLNNGTYTATITNTTAEDVLISGTIDGNPITSGNQTITFNVGNAASTATSTIAVSLISVTADGSSSSLITVQAKDTFNNNLASGGLAITLANNGSATISPITDHGNGSYTAMITSTVAESVVVSAKVDGSSITSGDKTVAFTAGIASAVNTTLSASLSLLRGNGIDTTTITIQTKDAYNNLLISGGNVLVLDDNNSAIISNVTDHNNGTYTATVNNTEIETTLITGTINGQAITSTATITFVAYGEAQINDSDGQFVNGVAPPGTSITVFDSNGFMLCTTTADALTGSYHCAITTILASGEELTVITTDLAGNNESSSTTTVIEDSDNDGISDLIETSLRTNGGAQDTTIMTDSDGDLLPDYAEFVLGSDFLSLDSPVTDGHLDDDTDGVANAIEHFLSNLGGAFDSELSTDTDLDGLPDVTELITERANFNNANKPTSNGSSDDNANSLTNAVDAYLQSLSIHNITSTSDYDGDGYGDALEVRLASNPLYANEKDEDNDGVNNAIEAFLTGTTDNGSNTTLNDRDVDGLPDIFELSLQTDLFDPSSAINYAEDGDSDSDGITDAIEFYLYGNTSDATPTSDIDSDTFPDTLEVTAGSNAFLRSTPSIWIDLRHLGSGSVELIGNIAGYQAPSPVLSWNLSEMLAKQPLLEDTYPTDRAIHISGLEIGIYNIQLSVSRWLNGTELSSTIDYAFNIKESPSTDTDSDGVSDMYDQFNGHAGNEEFLHTSLNDADRYYLQTQNGQIVRLGNIAKLSNNEVANITTIQIEEMVEFDQPTTLGSPSTPPAIADTANIFDFEILNSPETASTESIVIPLHHPLPDDPVLLKFETSSSLWSFFKITPLDNYSSALGTEGNCPPPEDNQYTQGLTAGHYCLQLQITDGSDNDSDHRENGAIRHLTGIGSGNIFPIGESPIFIPEASPVKDIGVENSPPPAAELTENFPSTTPAPNSNKTQQSGGGSMDHFMVVLLSLFALSVFSNAKAGPTGGNIVHGDGAITTSPNQTTITQNTSRLAIDWQEFNIAVDEGVTFIQPNGSAMVLNRDFSGSPSQVFGSINANGQVLLLNSAGILFGETASINVGSFLASDMETTLIDFSQGNFTLIDNNKHQGGITNQGNIQTKGRNGIYITGQFIHNTGTLTSSNGNIHLTAADQVIISTSNTGLLGVQLTQPLESEISPAGDLIYNDGDIVAFNGNIFIDLFYSDTIKANTVNNLGLVNAVEITEGNGQLFLTSTTSSELSDRILEVDNIIAGTETNNTPDSNTSIEIELTAPAKVSIDTIMPDCNADTSHNGATDCSKYQAIKNYLSRLLLGGELPE